MASMNKQWVWGPQKPSRVPEALKLEVATKANRIVEDHIKPEHVKPPPKDPRFNYIVDIFTRWRGRFFYFMAKYASPGPNRIAPFFEDGFARLEFVGNDRFDLAYHRHTGQWWTTFPELTLDEALELIKDGDLFQP